MGAYQTDAALALADHITEFGQSETYTPVGGTAFTVSVIPQKAKRQAVIVDMQESTTALASFACALSAFTGKTITVNEDYITFSGVTYLVKAFDASSGITITFDAAREDVVNIGMGREA